jgi:hypothetical protein
MSSTLNDTMKAAIDGVESAREGTRHTLAGTLATLVTGVNAVSGVVALLHRLDRDDGLAWFGLSRKRSPLFSGALFGAGVVIGAGLCLVFAPMSGADLRTLFVSRSGGPGDARGKPTSGARPEHHAPENHAPREAAEGAQTATNRA